MPTKEVVIRGTLEWEGGDLPPGPQPPTETITLHPGDDLQNAHDTAPEGALIQLTPGTYQGPLTSSKALRWESAPSVPPGRIARAAVLPVITANGQTLTNTAAGASFTGLCWRSTNQSNTILVDTGERFLLDRCQVLGDPITGQHRGLLAHGKDARVVGCFFDDHFEPGRDTNAIGGYDGTNGLVVEDCYLSAASQGAMFGGGDSASAERNPRNILFRKCHFTKNPIWYYADPATGRGMGQIKCAFELKCAENVTVEDCTFEYCGTGGGSSGYLVLLTPRNQNNRTPWSCIKNVTFRRCAFRYGGGGFQLLGTDDTYTSGPLDGVTIEDVYMENIDPKAGPWLGQGRIFLFNTGPANVHVSAFTATGANLNSACYFIGPLTGLKMSNALLPESKYGIKIDNPPGGQGWDDVITKLAPDAVIDLQPDDTGAETYPPFPSASRSGDFWPRFYRTLRDAAERATTQDV
jgi:hypothetical protein